MRIFIRCDDDKATYREHLICCFLCNISVVFSRLFLRFSLALFFPPQPLPATIAAMVLALMYTSSPKMTATFSGCRPRFDKIKRPSTILHPFGALIRVMFFNFGRCSEKFFPPLSCHLTYKTVS